MYTASQKKACFHAHKLAYSFHIWHSTFLVKGRPEKRGKCRRDNSSWSITTMPTKESVCEIERDLDSVCACLLKKKRKRERERGRKIKSARQREPVCDYVRNRERERGREQPIWQSSIMFFYVNKTKERDIREQKKCVWLKKFNKTFSTFLSTDQPSKKTQCDREKDFYFSTKSVNLEIRKSQ